MSAEPADIKARKQQLEYEHIARAISNLPSVTKLLKIQKLSLEATLPTRSNPTDAGWDLYASEDCLLAPNTRETVSTSISMEIPEGHVGLIWPRSGLATKKGVDVFAGVVDAGYRGEVKVCLYNSSTETISIQKGDRIAQILFQTISNFNVVESSNLTRTARGRGGFGSSGK